MIINEHNGSMTLHRRELFSFRTWKWLDCALCTRCGENKRVVYARNVFKREISHTVTRLTGQQLRETHCSQFFQKTVIYQYNISVLLAVNVIHYIALVYTYKWARVGPCSFCMERSQFGHLVGPMEGNQAHPWAPPKRKYWIIENVNFCFGNMKCTHEYFEYIIYAHIWFSCTSCLHARFSCSRGNFKIAHRRRVKEALGPIADSI